MSAETIQPLTPHLGAIVSGIRFGSDMSETTVESIRAALAEHLVVVLPEQDLSAAELRGGVARFGELFIHHADEGVLHADGLAEVLEMRKEPDGTRLFGGSDWHADVTFRKPGGHLSFLHAKTLPPLGGDTAFANAIAAFSALSNVMKQMLRPLRAVHSYDGPGRPDHPTQTAIHPVVRVHPDTGVEGLYINRMFVTRFEGMTAEESLPLITFLDQHISKPEFTCRVTWKPAQMTIWDNRFTLHYPINDFTGHRRLLLRCTTLESG